MKLTRTAKAKWEGSGKEGKGHLTTQSTVLEDTPYSFKTRFEQGVGTNPEELVGAAHAGCFTMKLSFLLGEAGFTPGSLNTVAVVTFEDGLISQIKLSLTGSVEGISKDKFEELAEEAKKTCPISQLLNTEISLETELNS